MDADRSDRPERLLSTRDVATRLRVSNRYVLHQIAEGRLRALALQTGSRPTLRVEPADFEAWVARFVKVRDGDNQAT